MIKPFGRSQGSIDVAPDGTLLIDEKRWCRERELDVRLHARPHGYPERDPEDPEPEDWLGPKPPPIDAENLWDDDWFGIIS